MKNKTLADRAVVLQEIQPGLLGLMDGSVSTLAPIFATAGLTGRPLSALHPGSAHVPFVAQADNHTGAGRVRVTR
jgi:hypothetical protein